MRSIVLSSVRLSVLILVVVAVIFSVAVFQSGNASVDTLPEFLPTQVHIQTEALGLSAAEVEQFITVPLEDEFNGVPFVDTLRSKSVPGLSSITLTFKAGTDLYTARQFVTERLAQGPSVVNVGTPPVMLEPLSSEQRVLMIGLSSKKIPLTDLSTTAFWRIRPRLLSVPGVANVSIWGQRDIQLQVLFDPARANAAGVTLDQVINTAGDATWTSPLSFLEASSPGADGLIDLPNQRLTVQHILPIRTPADLAKMPVEETGAKSVRLGDVATIVQSHPPLRGDAVLPSGAGLLMVVEKLPGANTLAVTRGVEAAMTDLGQGMSGVDVDTSVFRPADYIQTALMNISVAVLIGFLLLATWLAVSTRSWRVALIGVISIAVPLVVTVLVMSALGATLNMMTLAGLVIALGVVVDDAVAGAMTLRCHLEPRRDSDEDESVVALTWDAYIEMRRPLGWAVAILLLATAPVYFLVGGVTGAFVKPIVVVYAIAILASAAAALTVTPVLGTLLHKLISPEIHPNSLFRRREPSARPPFYAPWVDRAASMWSELLRQPLSAFVAIIVLVVVGAASLTQIHLTPLVPTLQDRNLLVEWQAAPGTSLVEMDRITSNAGQALRAAEGVTGASSHVGQALLGDQAVGVNSAQTWITIDPDVDYASTLAAVEGILAGYQGIGHTLTTYPQASIDSAPAGNGKAITVRLYGTDQDVLESNADTIRESIASVPGLIVDRKPAQPSLEPAVRIQTDVAAAARFGLKPGDIRRQTAVLIAGIPVGSYYHDQQIFDVMVWGAPSLHRNLTDVSNLLIATPTGGRVALGDIAKVSIQPAPTEIDHDRASRFIDVTADVKSGDLGVAVGRVSERVAGLQLPLGYHAEVTSDLQDVRASGFDLWLAAIGVIVGIFLLLQAAFQDFRATGLVFLTLPLGAVGALLAVLIVGPPSGLAILAGAGLVLAVAAREQIGLVRAIQRARAEDGETPLADIVLDATKKAAGPVGITAIAVALALLPFVVIGPVAGVEILRPFAAAVIGGLLTSTLLTLVIVPALYIRFAQAAPGETILEPQGEAS